MSGNKRELPKKAPIKSCNYTEIRTTSHRRFILVIMKEDSIHLLHAFYHLKAYKTTNVS